MAIVPLYIGIQGQLKVSVTGRKWGEPVRRGLTRGEMGRERVLLPES